MVFFRIFFFFWVTFNCSESVDKKLTCAFHAFLIAAARLSPKPLTTHLQRERGRATEREKKREEGRERQLVQMGRERSEALALVFVFVTRLWCDTCGVQLWFVAYLCKFVVFSVKRLGRSSGSTSSAGSGSQMPNRGNLSGSNSSSSSSVGSRCCGRAISESLVYYYESSWQEP